MNWRNEVKKLAEDAEAATKALGVEYMIGKVTDVNATMTSGVMMTPALAVDGQVKTVSNVPSPDEIKKMFIREQE